MNCIFFLFLITDYWLWQLTQPITRQTVQKWFIMKIGLGGGTEHRAVQCTLWILFAPWIHEHHDTRVACTQKDPRYFPRFGFELTMVEKEARKMVQVAGTPLWRLRNKFHVFALNFYQSALTPPPPLQLLSPSSKHRQFLAMLVALNLTPVSKWVSES